jgi:hypothetical protein
MRHPQAATDHPQAATDHLEYQAPALQSGNALMCTLKMKREALMANSWSVPRWTVNENGFCV